MSSFLTGKIDIQAHNEEVVKVWEAYGAGRPYRVPLSITGSITNYLLNPALNENGWTFRDYFENPDVQIRAQLEYQKWQRFNVVCDREIGLPSQGWGLYVDFQNSYDAGWFGCPLTYPRDQVPDTREILREDKERLYDMPASLAPDNGLMGRVIEFFDYMHDRVQNMEFEGCPVVAPASILGEGTDGPLDLAYKLRGADNLLVDMVLDESYYHDLMKYITGNLIERMRRMRDYSRSRMHASEKPSQGPFFFADDAIALISQEHYREYVYPYHKQIVNEFGKDGVFMHLCGDATRHFKFLKENLGVVGFDTGFPVDHGWLREQLGPDVTIQGGPTIMTIKYGSADTIASEVEAICKSGVREGGKFIMIAANNLAPCTPVENISALYEAIKAYGTYQTTTLRNAGT